MKKKLEFKTGIMHQLYVAVLASAGAVIVFGILIVLAAVSNDIKTIKQALMIMACVEGVIWLIFLLVRIIFRTKLTVTEKEFVMKMRSKILWEMDWSEIEKIEYFKCPWYFFLTLNFYSGNLVFTRINAETVSNVKRVKTANLFLKDIKGINEIFNKDIKIS